MARILLAAGVLVGCGPTLSFRARLANRAALDSGCGNAISQDTAASLAALEVMQLAENAFEVRGCGEIREYTRAGPGHELVAMAPAASVAAHDTGCAITQLQPAGRREPAERAFTGCGMTASYALECADGVGCHWAAVSVGRVAQSAPPMALPAPPTDTIMVPAPPGAT